MRVRTFGLGAALAAAVFVADSRPAVADDTCVSDTMTLSGCTLTLKRRIDPIVGDRDGFRLICGLDACSAPVTLDPTQNSIMVELADTGGACFSEMISNPGVCVQKARGYVCKPPKGSSTIKSIRFKRYPTPACDDLFVVSVQVRDTDLGCLDCAENPWDISLHVGAVDCDGASCPVDDCNAQHQTCM